MRSSVSRTEALILASIILLSPLHADEWFMSNPLGQKIGAEDSLAGEGWEIHLSESEEVLYDNGRVVEKKVFSEHGYDIFRGDEKTSVTLDSDGRPVAYECGGEKTTLTYSPSGRLLSSVVTEDGEIRSIRRYFYSYDGSAARTEADSSLYIFSSDDFYYSLADGEDHVIRKVGGDLYVRDGEDDEEGAEVTESEEGITITISEDESETWGRDGNIVRRTDAGGTTEYFYEGGSLTLEVRTEGDSVIRKHWDSGFLEETEVYSSGVIRSVEKWNRDGSRTKDMYRNGKHYATVSYDRDGTTVLDVEMH